jgi:hypothetical protein
MGKLDCKFERFPCIVYNGVPFVELEAFGSAVALIDPLVWLSALG